MLVTVAQALFFFLPALAANMAPVVFGNVKWLQKFKRPIDGGRKLGRQAVFGGHKTYFGFIVGVSSALIIGALQAVFYRYVEGSHWLFLFPYGFWVSLLLGFWQGFGSLLGDLAKSFIKRRLDKPSGSPFFPFDQLDFVLGGLAVGAVVFLPPWQHILALALLTPLLHLLSNFIGYKLGLKKVWW